ncbi:hypothetical protein DAPPUDRAFT_254882 [Daphnia pulex]|uniref:Uncharacterized protein n=1 Tax=Daphnia pulex TaxID=6669 RepID=E9H847_DAPPU|nr:hypothetical protein DAPPUDRAFT_254882 [Daphnia pulex]|eukprot:EFX72009.1 hypothetical protein DAPPUDRAFT_254882 [Daphnia pulex]
MNRCQTNHFSFTTIYENNLKYQETSDDEASGEEDLEPVVESSEAESDDSYGVPASGSGSDKSVDTGDSETKKAKLALEARNNNTWDEDSDLSNAFSDCSIDEDDD